MIKNEELRELTIDIQERYHGAERHQFLSLRSPFIRLLLLLWIDGMLA